VCFHTFVELSGVVLEKKHTNGYKKLICVTFETLKVVKKSMLFFWAVMLYRLIG